MSIGPNFFILGAPKTGTTSLAAWLAQHPQVFITEPKEPDYYNSDRKMSFQVSQREYQSYYGRATREHLAVGEASTAYLRSRVAVERILEDVPEARFIVGIRNPLLLAVSWHGQMLYEAWETEPDFERAWHLQESRRAGSHVPRLCKDAADLQYGQVCKLGEQLQRVFDAVPAERVMVYELEELRQPRELYLRVLKFLNVPDDSRTEFAVHNAASVLPLWLRVSQRLVSDLKRRLAIHHLGLGVLRRFSTTLSRPRPRASLSPALKAELCEHFRTDVDLLAKLTQRDLSDWLVVSDV